MKDNRGISLVELVVTTAVLGFVASVLAGVINMSLKFYSSEQMDSSMQYEAQMAINSIAENTMQTTGIAILNDSALEINNIEGATVRIEATEALFLGEFSAGSGTFTYNGLVIFGDYSYPTMSLYMREYVDVDFTATTLTDAMNLIQNQFAILSENEKQPYLLAQHVELMLVTPAVGTIETGADAFGNPIEVFNTPFSVDITVKFAAKTQKGIERQELAETMMIRNSLSSVYYGGIEYEKNR